MVLMRRCTFQFVLHIVFIVFYFIILLKFNIFNFYISISYKFGIVAMIAGMIGVPLGSVMARRIRPIVPNCDPLICAFGLFLSSPMVFFALVVGDISLGWCIFFVFLAEVTLNLTWSIVADMLLVSDWK